MPLRIYLLGNFRVEVDGITVAENRWPRRSAKQLVKLLCLKPGHQLHREQLMESLWPHAPPTAASNNLNKIVHMARRALEPRLKSGAHSRFLHRESDHVVLRAPGGLWIDAHVFEEKSERALKHGGREDCEAALTHYQGDLLEEDRYEEWLDAGRTRLIGLLQEVMLKLADYYEREGETQQCVTFLERILERDAANEAIHRRLMRLHAAHGNRKRALAQFDRCVKALADELDAGPAAETVTIKEEIMSGRLVEPNSHEPRAEPIRSPVDSLAVLRFDTGTEDPELDYLAEGLSESLITRLAELPGLRVMARSTVARYDPGTADPQLIGRELGVRVLLMGRLKLRAQSAFVAVELINVEDGSLIWGNQYEGESDSLLRIQEEITSGIAASLRLTLSAADRKRLQQPHTRNPRSYELYLKGRNNWNRRTASGLERGIEFFRQAIELDPTYSLAYAGLADCYNLLSLYGIAAPREAMPRARAAAARAIELDNRFAEGHTSMAYCKLYYDWDWLDAERLFHRALDLNPNYATANHWYHTYLTAMGRFDEQAVQVSKAKELDPLSPIIATEVGWGLYYARRYEDAAAHLARTLALESRFAVAHFILGLVLQQMGRTDNAVEELGTAIEFYEGGPFPLAIAGLGHAYARLGEHMLARRQLERLKGLTARHYVSRYCWAAIYTGLGNDDAALRSLEMAVEERSNRLIFLKVDPLFDGLRGHARFEQVLEQVGLT